MDPFDAFQLTKALRLHFTTKYDFFKYNSKLRASTKQKEAFLHNKQRYFYGHIGRHADPQGLVVSNLLANPKLFVADFIAPEGLTKYSEWKKRQGQLSYLFLQQLQDEEKYRRVIKIEESGLPWLLDQYIGGRIDPEVVIMVDGITHRLEKWQEINHPLIPETVLKLRKYSPFVKYDKERITKIFKGFLGVSA